MKGVVIKSTGSQYWVRNEKGEKLVARARGNLRLQGRKTTNPISVGDRVVLIKGHDEVWLINTIEERDNYLIRRSVNLSRQEHIIASNIDRVFVVITISSPRTSMGFIDRVLCTAEAYKIEPVLVFNKMDLYDTDDTEYLNAIAFLYQNIGYKILKVSAVTGSGLNDLKQEMKDRTCLFAGHSGVGKSSLLNAIDPTLKLRVGEISEAHRKGTHTTTFAEMHELSFGGFIVDTPGIKEFGVIDLEKHEVSHYFPEMFALLPNCRFNNCLHQNEPGCAVRKAVDEHRIASSRYTSYLGILNSEDLLEDWEKD
ncbi:MAG: ribosome small subunit-dependent GTPase A [Bacteroidia bacterium]|nr:ribosome small subunit-dependent GTPase A [Bacteroidia bacterium]